jgi:NitT/TauT family transport system ATP-binding protein
MGPRPSSIIYEEQISLPRPRTLEMELSDEFNHYFSNIRRHIHHN